MFDGNMSLEPIYVKKEEEWLNEASECVAMESTAGVGLSARIKDELELDADSELIQPPGPYLYSDIEVSVKIEHEGKAVKIEHGGKACNEGQLPCKTEMKSPKLMEDLDCMIVGSHEKIKTRLSPELVVLRNCFVRLERMHLYEELYICKLCQKKFSSKQSIKSHLPCHTEEESILQMKKGKKATVLDDKQGTKLCKTCGKLLKSIAKSFNIGENLCTCKKRYKTKCNLPNRSKKDTAEKSFPCNECGKKFKSNYLLTNHKRIHTGERPYSCPICNKDFSELVNLKRHGRIHTGERPYRCNICKRQFSVKSNLVTHIRIHTQEKPFTCDFCSKQFVHSSDLKKHERVHTGEKPFACDICQIRFARKYYLVYHLRNHSKKLD